MSMKKVFHDSRAKCAAIMTLAGQLDKASVKHVSDVKRDGNVFVSFRSTESSSAFSATMSFLDRALAANWIAYVDEETGVVKIAIETVVVN